MKKYIIVFFITMIATITTELKGNSFIIRNQTVYNESNLYFLIYLSDTFYIDTTTLIIKYNSNVENGVVLAIESNHGLIRNHEFITGYVLYYIDHHSSFKNFCIELSTQTEINVIDFNTNVKFDCEPLFPNDYDEYDQWYLERIQVPEAWSITTGNQNVKVAILDYGTDWEHNDLGPGIDGYENTCLNPNEDAWVTWNNPCSGNKQYDGNSIIDDWKGYGLTINCPEFGNLINDSREYDLNYLYSIFIGDPEAAESVWMHGTLISGIIGAKTNNNDFIAGISGGWSEKGVSLLHINIGISDHPPGSLSSRVQQAIEYSINLGINKPNIIQMAFGTSYSQSLAEMINTAFSNGIFLVASAGNGNDPVHFPASNENVFGVGASGMDDFRRAYSNWGSELELCAPGENITGLKPDNSMINVEGKTSAASAMISGTVALMLSKNPNLTNEEIKNILRESADKVHSDVYQYDQNGTGRCDEMGYGRLNTYKAVCMAWDHEDVEEIESNTTWSVPKTFVNNVIVKTGFKLTITSEIQFGPNAKLIVEPGATLEIDAGILTNLKCCDYDNILWPGVEIWGNWEKSQYRENGIYYQGKVILKNQAIIENAEKGILLGNKIGVDPVTGNDIFNDHKNGGIISITNNGNPEVQCAKFINNETSIIFKPYKNYIPNTSPKILADNISAINNCYFDNNTDYLEGTWMGAQIYLHGIKGFRIKGCTFENNNTITQGGHGINAWNAGYYVEAICNSTMDPCPVSSLDNSIFKNFIKGVNLAAGGTYTITVKNSIFINNSNGIVLNTVNNATILFNDFFIGYVASADEQACGDKGAGYGIDMIGCKSFAIEENFFTKAQGAPLGNYIGIRVNGCPSESDNIYLNEFVGLSQGNLAQGTNRSLPEDDGTGVAYLCNQNLNNSYDFYVGSNSRIRGKMGSLTSPSGNELTNPAVSIMQFQNDGTQYVEYYYNVNEPDQWLTEYSAYVSPFWINYSNTCRSHYGGGGGGTGGRIVLTDEEILQKEQEYYSGLNNYNNVVTLYESLKDGGNTEQLQTEVATAWPSEMWAIRNELLGKSPHLSKEVLMTAADKTDVLPESVIFEIMAANPDELRKEDLISYLENKAQPLPGYMIEILRQVANGVTYKTALKCQISAYHSQKVNAANDIIRSILNDSISDYNLLRNWYDNIGGYEADKQIIASYINDSVYATALNLIQLLPSLYELSGDQLTEYEQYKSFTEWLIGCNQQNRTVYELDSIEIANLVNIAENASGEAKYGARGILEFAYGYHYCDCPELPGIAGLKSSKIITDNGINNFGLEITAQPNPAKEWVAFNFRLPPGLNTATVKITDITGKVVDVINLDGNVGQALWDSRKVNPGIYFYTINAGNASKSDKLVIE